MGGASCATMVPIALAIDTIDSAEMANRIELSSSTVSDSQRLWVASSIPPVEDVGCAWANAAALALATESAEACDIF
jgi:hypothetical protein